MTWFCNIFANKKPCLTAGFTCAYNLYLFEFLYKIQVYREVVTVAYLSVRVP